MIIYLPYVKKIFIMLLSELIEILEKKKKEYGDAEVFSSNGLYRYPINRNSIEPIQERNVT